MGNDKAKKTNDALATAMALSTRGFALIVGDEHGSKVAWANLSFFKVAGLLDAEAYSVDARQLWEGLGGAKADLIAALKAGAPWSGSMRSEWAGGFQAKIESAGNGAAALWVDRVEDGESMRARLEGVLKKIHEISSAGERSDFGGPKSFWRSVGAVWTVCSRNELPVALALMHLDEGGESLDADAEAKLALGRTFRRASDVAGRLGSHAYGVFVVGQDALRAKERFEMLMREMAGMGCIATIGLSCGIPERGSSTQATKAKAKMLLDSCEKGKEGLVVGSLF